MKTSLKKLGMVLSPHHHLMSRSTNRKRDRKIQPLSQLDELANANQAMTDMRDCYDSLLSAAAAATNSAYEFSESLREMGVCLLQKIALNDDEECGQAMLKLGKVQFELQKLVDNYRSHIFQTITVPSESLINELQTVEEMKHQCDEKRDLYDYMKANYRDKGRSKSGKGERFSLQQLQEAKDEFDEEATLFVFRLKSLKQGQSRSLLTQAARHHAAQLSFFRKAVKSLEAVEPHVQMVTKQQHIDYQFSGLEDDESEDGEDGEDEYGSADSGDDEDDSDTSSLGEGELSFDFRRNPPQFNPLSSTTNTMQESLKGYQDSFAAERKLLSQSAPLISQRQVDSAEKIRQLRPSSSKKFHAYVLPRPSENPVTPTKSSPPRNQNLHHSYPLEPKKYEKIVGTGTLSGPIILNSQSVLKESNNNRVPPPLSERIAAHQLNLQISSGSKKPKLQSFSGPITSMPMSSKPSSAAANPVNTRTSWFSSGPILKTSTQSSPSPQKVSPTASPTFMSSPRISELHELPRPPAINSARSPGFVGFSAPLVSRSSENSITPKSSPLPAPPVLNSSMPLNNPGAATRSPTSKPLKTLNDSEKLDDFASPPLSPIMLSNVHPT